MYKRSIGVVLGIMFLMVVLVSQANTKVYAFSFEVEQEQEAVVDEAKAAMFAGVIEAQSTRLAEQCSEAEQYRATTEVNVRTAPGMDGSIVRTLSTGATVSIEYIEGDWCKLSDSNEFVHSKYLERI